MQVHINPASNLKELCSLAKNSSHEKQCDAILNKFRLEENRIPYSDAEEAKPQDINLEPPLDT